MQIYTSIESGEQLLRDNNINESLKEYEKAFIDLKNSQKDINIQDNVQQAINLLIQDLEVRINELEVLNRQKNLRYNQGTTSINNARIQEINRTLTSESPVTDPLLISITNKLQNNLLQNLTTNLKCNRLSPQDIEIIVQQQLTQFKREMAIFEQKKFRDFELKFEQMVKENRKLSNQVVRLKNRWDSLVESAKQKRNLQEK